MTKGLARRCGALRGKNRKALPDEFAVPLPDFERPSAGHNLLGRRVYKTPSHQHRFAHFDLTNALEGGALSTADFVGHAVGRKSIDMFHGHLSRGLSGKRVR